MSFKHTFFGAAVGFLLTGPIGALLGAVVGTVLGSNDGQKQEKIENERVAKTAAGRDKTKTSEFTYSLMILFAVVIKADNKVRKSEVLFVKEYLIGNFGSESAKEMMQILKSLLNKEINSGAICDQIRVNSDYYFRMELVHLLFKLAAADGRIVQEEFVAIRNIASKLSLGQLDFVRIASMFASYGEGPKDYDNQTYKNDDKIDNAFNILGLPANSSKEAVKSAYRKLSKEYHPDRVAHLGEEYQEIAKEKFIKVKDAYDTVMAMF